MIGVGIAGAGQDNGWFGELGRYGIARAAAGVAVSDCGLSALALGGKQSADAALRNVQPGGDLADRHLACQNAIEHVSVVAGSMSGPIQEKD